MGVVIRIVFLGVVAWLVWRGLRAVLGDARRANMPRAPGPGGPPEALALTPCPRCGAFLTDEQRPVAGRPCAVCGRPAD